VSAVPDGGGGGLHGLLGLALRARALAIGREACKRAARRGELHALVLADDAGRSAARDCGAVPATVLLRSGLDKRALGALVGRGDVAALGITDPHLAAGMRRQAPAWEPERSETRPEEVSGHGDEETHL
jgi:hypothetical protein